VVDLMVDGWFRGDAFKCWVAGVNVHADWWLLSRSFGLSEVDSMVGLAVMRLRVGLLEAT